MEMPEGWKWLKEKATAERLEGQPFGTRKRIPEVVELIKEMAEALEAISKTDAHILMSDDTFYKMEESLQQFKEWK